MPPAPRLVDTGPAFRLAALAESRGDLIGAINHYREALRIDPANAIAPREIARVRAKYYLQRAESSLEAGDYNSAQSDVSTAIDLEPGNTAAAELMKKIEQARSAETKKRPPGE